MADPTKRNSFLLYSDSLDVLDDLTDEQAGQLFKAIKDYQSGTEITLTQLLKVAFTPFRNHLERDNEKYEKICERNKGNGSKGGRPRGKALTTIDGVKIPDEKNGRHFIYLIYDNIEDEYKIGETRNLIQRRYDIKRPTNNLDIVYFALTERRNAINIENGIINKYKQIRISGDWFNFNELNVSEVISFISQKTQSLSNDPRKADSDLDSGSGSDPDIEKPKKKANKFDYSSWPELPSEQIMNDWVMMRNRLKANVTQTVVSRLGTKLTRAKANGYSVDDCLGEAVERNWKGFDVDWMPEKPAQGTRPRKYVS